MSGIIRVANRDKEKSGIDITRPGILGNPFKIGKDGDRDDVVDAHKRWLYHHVCCPGLNGEFEQVRKFDDLDYVWCVPSKERGMEKYRAAVWFQVRELQKRFAAGEELVLICCCFPLSCHGDNLKNCVEWLQSTHPL